MGPEPAVNAVYFNKIQAIEDPEERQRFIADRRADFEKDIDLINLASEDIVDAVIEPDDLRAELARRLATATRKDRHFSERHHGVPPV
jgi:acetyl-CoA carboxylase carboxyltransferase component